MKRFRTIAAGVASAVVLMVAAACGSSPVEEPKETQDQQQVEVPEEVQDKQIQSEPDQAFENDNVATGQADPAEVTAYIETVIDSTDKMWVRYFESVGAQYPSFFYMIVTQDEPFQSTCMKEVVTSTYDNAFFCSTDSMTIEGVSYTGSVVLPLDTFRDMWNGDIFGQLSPQVGDFAAATIVMHEVAHDAWWNLQRAFPKELPPIGQPNQKRTKYTELVADCGAGLGANNAYKEGALSDTDIAEATSALGAIGDKVDGGSDPHGTPPERQEAFMLGYNTGSPDVCIETYWPNGQE